MLCAQSGQAGGSEWKEVCVQCGIERVSSVASV